MLYPYWSSLKNNEMGVAEKLNKAKKKGYKQKPRDPFAGFFAERKRFELSIQLPVYYLSRVAPSTTRTPLYFSGWNPVERAKLLTFS
jgi:hypothetical protein